jgi:hypothetical protein
MKNLLELSKSKNHVHAVHTVCIVPDFKVSTMKKFLELMYTGTTLLENRSELSDLDSLSKLVTGYPVLKWNVTVSSPTSGDGGEPSDVTATALSSNVDPPMCENDADSIGIVEESIQFSGDVVVGENGGRLRVPVGKKRSDGFVGNCKPRKKSRAVKNFESETYFCDVSLTPVEVQPVQVPTL